MERTNAFVNRSEPWTLAKQGKDHDLRQVLGELYGTLEAIGQVLNPFLPETSDRLLAAVAESSSLSLFPKE